MRKILLLLLTIGFFAKPTFAQEITASASSPYLCRGADLFLNYTGGVPNSVWEFFDDGTGTWESLGPADQPLNLKGIITMYAEQVIEFRVESPDGESYVFSNVVQVTGSESLGNNVAQINGDYYKCQDNNTATTLAISDGFEYNTNILWNTGETTPSISVDPTTTTDYSMTSTDFQGCVTTATHTITVLPLIPPLIQTTPSGSVCSGASVTLSFAGFSTSSPCTLSPNGQNPAAAITPVPDGSQTEVTLDGHLGEYSIINVDKGKYYSFFTREISGGGVGTENWYSTITSADGSQVYTSGLYGQAIWTATYTGQVRFYSNNINCVTNNAILLHRFLQCFTDPPASFLWMPGGQTTPSITVNPGSTTNYTLTVSNVSTLQFNSCPGSANLNVEVQNKVWVLDADNDGYYTGDPVTQCTSPGTGYIIKTVQQPGDCNDADAILNPATVWYKDADNDGYSDGATKTQCDQPTGYKLATDLTATSGDCNDNDATVNPQTVWVLDADNDGYYVGAPVTQCSSPGTGYVVFTTQISGDCNDNDANVHTSSTISVQPGITTCSGSTATITASSSASNPTYSWYADAAGQNLLQQGTSASFTTPVLSGNTIYYVSVADGSAGCTSALTPASVTVNPLPVVAPITYSGSTTVCSGITGVQLTESTTGGSWSASNNAASVTGAGVVTFATVTATTSVTIYYTLTTNGCSNKVGLPFTVSPSITLPAITGNTNICGINATTTLSDATGGGTWSSTNTAVATVNNSTGVVTGKSAGSAMITYTVSSGGCTASVSTSVSVNTLPVVAAISGTSVLIKGTSCTLTDVTKGGIWSSSNTAIATVSTSGSVKGIAAGTCTIYYTVTSGGCSAAANKSITVYNPLSATVTSGKISCNGGTTTLTINVIGGSGGYQYSLNGGKFQTGNTYTVNAGTYLVVVKDNMAEQFTISGIIIAQPAALGLKLVSKTNASSKTATNGSFTVSGSGGTSPYQFSKNGGSTYQTSGIFGSLAPGTYNVSVKDASSCVALNKLSVTVGYGNYLSVSEGAMPQINSGDEIVATVSPNPTETEFKLTLSGNNNKQVELRVIDMYGRLVYHTTGSGNQSYKFGERFTSGMYIIEILQGKVVKNLKIIKGR